MVCSVQFGREWARSRYEPGDLIGRRQQDGTGYGSTEPAGERQSLRWRLQDHGKDRVRRQAENAGAMVVWQGTTDRHQTGRVTCRRRAGQATAGAVGGGDGTTCHRRTARFRHTGLGTENGGEQLADTDRIRGQRCQGDDGANRADGKTLSHARNISVRCTIRQSRVHSVLWAQSAACGAQSSVRFGLQRWQQPIQILAVEGSGHPLRQQPSHLLVVHHRGLGLTSGQQFEGHSIV